MLRGINRQKIFYDSDDYNIFLKLLRECKQDYDFRLYAWCLMPNHIHLMIKEENEPVSSIIQKTMIRFVYRYNSKYERCGHLFQDRFRSETVESEQYFLTLIRYIHLNPVKAGLCVDPEDYPYSSYPYYFTSKSLVDYEKISAIMSRNDFIHFHLEESKEDCMDYDLNLKHRKTDQQIKDYMWQKYNCANPSQFQLLSPSKGESVLIDLLAFGGSIRQVSRLTGVSFARVRKHQNSKNI